MSYKKTGCCCLPRLSNCECQPIYQKNCCQELAMFDCCCQLGIEYNCHHYHHHHHECDCQKGDSNACQLLGIGTQLQTANQININNQDAIKFDKILHHTHKNIHYNPQTGIFHLTHAGNYQINWNVAVEGSNQKPYISFAILANQKIVGESTLPLTVGQLSGSCLLTVSQPVDIALINNTDDIVQLAKFAPVANLTIAGILTEAP